MSSNGFSFILNLDNGGEEPDPNEVEDILKQLRESKQQGYAKIPHEPDPNQYFR